MVLDDSSNPIFAARPDGHCHYANKAFANYVGKTLQDISNKAIQDVIPHEETGDTVAIVRSVFESGEVKTVEVCVSRPDGDRYYERTFKPSVGGSGGIESVVCISKEITERKRMETAARDSEARYRALMEFTPEPVGIHRNGKLVYVNPASVKMMSAKSARDLIGMPILDIVHPDFHQIVLNRVKSAANSGLAIQAIEEKFITLDGRTIDVEIHSVSVVYEGEPAIQIAVRDITERNVTTQNLRIAATVFESQEGMFVTDATGTILRVNNAFTDITGYGAEEALGQNPRMRRSGQHDAAFYAAMWESITGAGFWKGEIWNRHKNGGVYPEWLTITAVRDAVGEITNYVATLTDITERKKAEEEIRNLAFYDPLTHLPNRRLLLDRLSVALPASARRNAYGAILFLDLDNFKTLNDTKGHEFGDLLLIEVARRLLTCVRAEDTVARLGGDEFLVMLEDLNPDYEEAVAQAEAIGEKIRAALSVAYSLPGYSHQCSSSIGISLFKGVDVGVGELLKRGDIAMYQAKSAGRNNVRLFRESS
jgi:diguanylate cyclase (GGDEF)-like protein/PAS domain S-box-containing protein